MFRVFNTSAASAVLALAALAALPSFGQAANRYYDGGTADIAGSGDGFSGGGTGNWNTTIKNWDQGNGLARVAWINGTNDNAVLSGTAATITLTAPITAGGLQLNVTGYTLTGTTANSLTVNGIVASTSQALTLSGGAFFFAGSTSNTMGGLLTVAAPTGGTTLELQKSGSAQAIAGPLTIGTATNSISTVKYNGTSTDMIGGGLLTINARSRLDFNGATDTIGDVVINSTGMTSQSSSITNTAGSGNLTIGSLSITPVAGITSTINSGSSGTLTLGGTVTFSAAGTGKAQITGQTLDLGGNRTFNVTRGTATDFDLDIASAVAGIGNTVTSSGAGIIQLSGSTSNSYSGLTTQSTGTLLLAKSDTANAIAGGGLTIGGPNDTAATVRYTGSSSDMMGTGAVTINGRGILDFNGKTDTIGDVSIVSTGATTTNLTPITNTAGGGNLTVGSLSITSAAGLTSVVNAGNGGTITVGGNVTFIAVTSGQGQITGQTLNLGGATREFNVGLGTGANQDLQVVADVSGIGAGVTKTGAGRLALLGINTYTGTTTVNTGTLLINGDNSLATGAVAVNSGMLGGKGTIGGDITVNDTATITAGADSTTTGKLTTGTQAWKAGGTYSWKIANPTRGGAGAVGGWDQLAMTTLDLSALGPGNQFKIVAVGMGAMTLQTGDSFQIATYTGTNGSPLASMFVLDVSQLVSQTSNADSIGNYGLSFDGSGISLSYSETQAAPEPGVAALVGLAGVSILGRRRVRAGTRRISGDAAA